MFSAARDYVTAPVVIHLPRDRSGSQNDGSVQPSLSVLELTGKREKSSAYSKYPADTKVTK
jgi:hypothetical protein